VRALGRENYRLGGIQVYMINRITNLLPYSFGTARWTMILFLGGLALAMGVNASCAEVTHFITTG
jgi:hypothetical protein